MINFEIVDRDKFKDNLVLEYCSNGEIILSSGCVEAMNYPEYLQFMVNPETHMLFVRPWTGKSDSRITFATDENGCAHIAKCGKFLEKIAQLIGIEPQEVLQLRFGGCVSDNGGMLFDLGSYMLIPGAAAREE